MLRALPRRWSRAASICALAVLGAALFASGAGAQTQELTVQITGMTGDGWPQAQAVATTLGPDGRPVSGLTAESFTASLDGADVPVVEVAQGVDSDQPIDVVLALDVSGSMEGSAIDQAKGAALSFLDQLGAGDRIAIVTFGTTVDIVLPFTNDRASAQGVIAGLAAEGGTALFEATAESVLLATGGGSDRRAIVLLSDGVDNGSSVSLDAALATAETGGVPVFAIGLGEDLDRAYLQELTQSTGGQFAETPSPEGLAALYQDVGELLRGQYILTLDASGLDIERSQPATLRLEATQADLTGSDERAVCAQNVCAALTGIANGDRLEGSASVSAHVVSGEPVTDVSLLVDGSVAQTLDTPPYDFTIDASVLAEGDHVLAVTAETPSDSVTSGEIAVRVGAAAGAGGGLTGGLLPIAAVAGIAVAAIALAFILLRRRGRGGKNEPAGPQPDPSPPDEPMLQPRERGAAGRLWGEGANAAPAPARQRALGSLRITRGEMAGQAVDVGTAPVSIGTGYRCQIRVPEEGEEVATEHLRVWVREDHLVVHELRRLTAFGPAGGRWEFLAAGDTFGLGSHTFEFQLADQEATQAPAPQASTPAPPAADAPPAAIAPTPSGSAEPAQASRSPSTHIPTVRGEGEPRTEAESPFALPAEASNVQNEQPAEPSAGMPETPTPDAPGAPREGPAEPPPSVPEPQSPDAQSAPREGPAVTPPGAPEPQSPDVPNVLRDRPAEAPPDAAPPAPEAEDEVPNILRDRTAGEDATKPPASEGGDEHAA